MESKEFETTVMRVGVITIIGNALLTIAKVFAGLLSKSSSLISDGIHSASDVLSTVIVMIGAKLSSKKADKEHPFGHERIESISSIILAMLLAGTSLFLGYNGVSSIISFVNGEEIVGSEFTLVALICAASSIATKFLMFLYTISEAKRIKSTALRADSYHHLSDSLSSIGSVLGVIGMMIGGEFAILDPIASIIISLFILKVAFDIAKDGFDEVLDVSAGEEVEKEIRNIASSVDGVKGINSLKTRKFGNKIYVEIAIFVDENITVREGHDIAQKAHDLIEDNMSEVKHCMIHIDPDNEVEE